MLNISSEKAASRTKRTLKPKTQRGVILVFVLLFLALCSAILVRSHSLVTRTMVQAAHAERELQNRWAVVSMRRGLLLQADSLLEMPTPDQSPESPKRKGIAQSSSVRRTTWQVDLVLSGVRYNARLDDENAKFPLNRLHESKKFELWRSEVRNLVAGNANLRQSLPSGRLSRWGDVFQKRSSTDVQTPQLTEFLEATTHLTLVTNGHVNYRNAPPQVLNSLWKVYFNRNAPDCIFALRRIQGPIDIAQHCRANGLSESESVFASDLLTDSSRCASVTISRVLGDGETVAARYYRRTQEGYAEDHFGDPGW